ncbi:hypothetical protein Tco_1235617, partial [Tanacetum coccineum]
MTPSWSDMLALLFSEAGILHVNWTSYRPTANRMDYYCISGDPDSEVHVAETFHEQTNDELTKKEVKQMEDDDQAIQIILMGLPEDIYCCWIANQNLNPNGNGNVVAARADNNAIRNNGDLEEIKEVNANCILMANLQQAWGGYLICLPKRSSILSYSIPFRNHTTQNDSNVISGVSNIEQSGGTVEQYPTTSEETHALYDSLYNNLATKVETVNSVNHNLKETNVELTTELEFSDDTTPSVARKFLNEVKSTIVTLQRVVKQKMTLDIHNWSSSAHQELLKIEAAKFVRDFKSLANEADESLAKHKALEFEIERLLRAVVSQYIMSIVQNPTVVETSDIQTELERMKERQPNAFQSERPKFSKTRVPQKVDETNDSSNPVTSNSVPTPQESKVMKNDNVIAPGMFRINPSKTSRKDKFVPINKVRASVRTNPITVSQSHVITKKDVNSDSNGFSSTGVNITAKTRRPQPRSNAKNDRVPSESMSSCIKNKEVEVEEHHRKLLLSKNKKHMSSECNNVKLAIRNDKSEFVCAMCKKCLITANHDVCVLNYVNGMNSRGKKQKANVSNIKNQKKQKPKVKKPEKVGSQERLASPKPSKPII